MALSSPSMPSSATAGSTDENQNAPTPKHHGFCQSTLATTTRPQAQRAPLRRFSGVEKLLIIGIVAVLWLRVSEAGEIADLSCRLRTATLSRARRHWRFGWLRYLIGITLRGRPRIRINNMDWVRRLVLALGLGLAFALAPSAPGRCYNGRRLGRQEPTPRDGSRESRQ